TLVADDLTLWRLKDALASAEPAVDTNRLSIEFIPRPSIVRYRQWVKEERIEHVAAGFIADLPMVRGEKNGVKLALHNGEDAPVRPQVRFTVPAGWRLDSPVLPLWAKGGQTSVLTALVTPPLDSAGDGELFASVDFGGTIFKTSARGHPVPRTQAPRLK